MFVGAGIIKINIPYSRTLKDKRKVIKSIINSIQSRYNISISEVASQDNTSVGEIGFSMVSSDKNYINSLFDKILNFINENYDIVVINEDYEIMKYWLKAEGWRWKNVW